MTGVSSACNSGSLVSEVAFALRIKCAGYIYCLYYVVYNSDGSLTKEFEKFSMLQLMCSSDDLTASETCSHVFLLTLDRFVTSFYPSVKCSTNNIRTVHGGS